MHACHGHRYRPSHDKKRGEGVRVGGGSKGDHPHWRVQGSTSSPSSPSSPTGIGGLSAQIT